ncbi:hypothetical protein HMI54_014743 [Coelomomyces lativittatus]|nr:hypothetical protein HMI56_006457 [Coelomomyces lativittatus]KAJ1517808.1 hypothetical protein HMI55_005864 [Coelomomyces lativittatus]KAJ1518577.1 hypothetical protein HMI54_014743 [Coelomomyces lativittatus]
MSFFFKSQKSKSPPEIVKAIREAVLRIEQEKKPNEKLAEEISKYLTQIKSILSGDGDVQPSPEVISALAQEVYSQDLLSLLLSNFQNFEFEAKKDVVFIVNTLLRRQMGSRQPTVEYFASRESVLISLFKGYESSDLALNCGMILRECARYQALCKILLYHEFFWKLFVYVESSTFDTASDAFATFKDLLTKHKDIASQFIETNYTVFFEHYTQLLNSNNYVTKRQSLKLLGELLLDRSNFNIMTKYIASSENLKLMMNLLKDKSRNIQFEAFHVFKIFVANPNKSKSVSDILLKNREKLLQYLSNFHSDKTGDDLFMEEKQFLVKQITDLGREGQELSSEVSINSEDAFREVNED